jgi:flavodoxin
MSKTGRTRKVAEAIYGEISGEKELKPIEEVADIGAYDFAFLGFPMRRFGPDDKTRELIQRHCSGGRKVALFVTHGASEDYEELPEWMEKFRQAASGADLVGVFDCQGQLATGVELIMKIAPSKRLRSLVKLDNSKGQPDESRLEKARAFARGTMLQLEESSFASGTVNAGVREMPLAT